MIFFKIPSRAVFTEELSKARGRRGQLWCDAISLSPGSISLPAQEGHDLAQHTPLYPVTHTQTQTQTDRQTYHHTQTQNDNLYQTVVIYCKAPLCSGYSYSL